MPLILSFQHHSDFLSITTPRIARAHMCHIIFLLAYGMIKKIRECAKCRELLAVGVRNAFCAKVVLCDRCGVKLDVGLKYDNIGWL